jgi:hypothetical protein
MERRRFLLASLVPIVGLLPKFPRLRRPKKKKNPSKRDEVDHWKRNMDQLKPEGPWYFNGFTTMAALPSILFEASARNLDLDATFKAPEPYDVELIVTFPVEDRVWDRYNDSNMRVFLSDIRD